MGDYCLPGFCTLGIVHQVSLQQHAVVSVGRGVAGKAGDWDMAMQLFEDLQATEMKPDVWTHTSLINACQTCGKQWKQGIAFFQEMESRGECCLTQQAM